ncbi:MAG: flagellar hook protein FlgE [Gallionella sp.]|nr:MAG: flagellar hook protein FlgE [Gallionella sp.]
MDTAISGQGFYQMIDQNGAILYSRNGQFQVDKNGYIVNNQGHKVNGYQAVAGVVTATQGALQISASDLTPRQTEDVAVGANLDSRAVVPLISVFDPAAPTSYNNSTSLTVYDSLGVNHIGSLYFQRQPIPNLTAQALPSAPTTTSVSVASISGLAVGNTITLPNGGGAGIPVTTTITAITAGAGTTGTITYVPATVAAAIGDSIPTNAGSAVWKTYLTVDGVPVPATAAAMATLTFSTTGALVTSLPVAPATVGAGGTVISDPSFTPLGANPLPLNFNFSQVSQYGGNFGISSLTQDGYASGRLNGFSTGSDGSILGRYSNGQTQILGQMLLANFTNPQGLQPVGNNEWIESSASGGPLVGTPASGSLGVLQSSAVEDSNVDLTAELVTMITAQRVYQANAQTIKAQDQVLQTLVNLR